MTDAIDRLSEWIAGPAGLPAQIAHRLTQPRRRRKVVAVRWCTVSCPQDLVGRRGASIAWLADAAVLPANAQMLFPELANDEVRTSHFAIQQQGMGLGVAALRDAWVSGPSLVGRSWLLYRLGPLVPWYVDEYLSAGTNIGDRKVTRKLERRIAGVSVLVTHWNSNVYGHWLLEGMPKLLLLRRWASELPTLRIVVPRSLRSWVAGWIRLILPEATIETYDDATEYLRCETLLIPTLLSDPVHHHFHPAMQSLLEPVLAASTNASGRKLYVTRAAPSFYRELSNQTELEAIAGEEGLEIVQPDSFSIAEQIALFASADLVVGEFGSGMHSTLFGPVGAKVFCLNWINGLQSRIGQLKRQRVGYLLPSDGVPVKYVEGAARQRYHVDPARFRDCVRKLVNST